MKLKPCPFCGSPGMIGECLFNHNIQIRPELEVKCSKGCVGFIRQTTRWDWDKKEHVNIYDEVYEYLVNKWNTRV